MFGKEDYAYLYGGWNDRLEQSEIDKLNEWLSNAETTVKVSYEYTADGWTMKFFKE